MSKISESRAPLSFQLPSGSESISPRTRQKAQPRKAMIVGADPQIVQALQQAIAAVCPRIAVERNPHHAALRLACDPCDILLFDVSDDSAAGLETLRFLRGSNCQTVCILIAAHLDAEWLPAAVHLGIHGLLLKPLSAARLRDALDKAMNRVEQECRQASHLALACSDVAALREERVALAGERDKLQESVMDALLAALAAREVDAVPHALRVQAYVSYFARAAGYPEVLRPHLERAALLHDVGKIGLSDNLLFRPGVLTQAELARMRPHTILGEKILARIDFLRPAAQIVRHHHEWFDGSGHPDGLRCERIPLGARLFAIIDALDAFTTNRPYRSAQSFELAQQEIVGCAGTHFDPQLTRRFRTIPASTWSKVRRQVEEQCKGKGLHLAGPC